ncbi:MAG TPA: glycosyltransferase family 25 protein [Rhabdochlamydiaceae bacterium]|nr:glycosyltransferase family 25 protein [Rhabdochlamydiaceae bacterium]
MTKWFIFFLAVSQLLFGNSIDCIYVINQTERPDHWEMMQKILEAEKLQATRINAINGAHLSQKRKKELQKKHKLALKADQLGHLLTQISVIKDAYEKGSKLIWILEDDCTFTDSIQKNLEARIEKLNSDWDLFYTGPSFCVSRKGMERIIHYYDSLKEPNKDESLQSIPGIRVYSDENPLVKRSESSYLLEHETPLADYLKPIEVVNFRSGVDLVDCIYVINLDARKDKWDRLKPLFEERNLKVNRVSGINGWQLSKEDKKQLAGPYRPRLKGGQIGCLLSHLSILKDASRRGFDLIWVLEDDIEFTQDVSKISDMLRKLSKMDPDWDLFYTDPDFKSEKGEPFRPAELAPRPDQILPPLEFFQERILIDEEIMQVRSRFATHSMLISKKGIKKILDYFTHVYLFSPIDWDIHYIPSIRQYAACKDIVTVWRNNPYSDTIPQSSLNTKNN